MNQARGLRPAPTRFDIGDGGQTPTCRAIKRMPVFWAWSGMARVPPRLSIAE